jgi:DNA primase
MLDADRAGLEGADRILPDLRDGRLVRLPEGQDVRDVLQGPTPELMDELLDQADETHRIGTAFGVAS